MLRRSIIALNDYMYNRKVYGNKLKGAVVKIEVEQKGNKSVT